MSHDSGFPSLDDDEVCGDLLRAGRQDAMSPEARKRVVAAIGVSTTATAAVGLSAAGAGGKSLVTAAKGGLFAWAGKGVVAVALVGAAGWTAVELAPRALAPAISTMTPPGGAPAAGAGAIEAPRPPGALPTPEERTLAPDAPAPGARSAAKVTPAPMGAPPLPPRPPPTPPSEVAAPGAARTGGAPAVVAPPAPAAGATSAAHETPQPAAPQTATADPRAPADPSTPKSDTLGQETALLGAARRALRGGDGGAALAHLDTFARSFPTSKLAPEALALRLDALVAAGRREEAASIARALLLRNPSGPYAARLRALVEK